MGDQRGPRGGADDTAAERLVCDFCGVSASHVRRVALDRDYERLQTPHKVQYACAPCSAEKERRRLKEAHG